MGQPTPSPWSCAKDQTGEYYVIKHESEDVDSGDIAHVFIPPDDEPQAEANAVLITSAHDMRDALADMLSYYGHSPDYGHMCNVCHSWRRALLKSRL
jgi:two-component SAPR family response regulator